ncbi:hypothetical protein SDC9_109090 [bioreactor metagenome]|uniref:Uncharacterized protein n=1 Tax=bioreactor metagenome TaxID=1076179 RepID=A0A645BKB2_9ZZZZ
MNALNCQCSLVTEGFQKPVVLLTQRSVFVPDANLPFQVTVGHHRKADVCRLVIHAVLRKIIEDWLLTCFAFYHHTNMVKLEGGHKLFRQCSGNCIYLGQASQGSDQFIHAGGFQFAGPGQIQAAFGLTKQLRDHHCHDQENGQCDEILRLMHQQGIVGQNKKVVEQQKGRNAG